MNKKSNPGIKVNKIKTKEVIRKYGFKRILGFFLLALGFIIFIVTYHYLLSFYIKQSIITQSELNAFNSAKEVEIYLSTGTDLISLTEYSVNKMLSDGDPEEKILEYLTDETNRLQNSILPATTGLYGCINGKYFDGSGWDPGPDYVPEERPWYTEAIADIGEIVLINPYFDMYSQEVVMTIAKALPNGRDVVAIDVTLGRIQEITENGLAGDSGTTRMIISSNGFVVAHTDTEERGKNYLEETEGFGSYILKSVAGSDENAFELSYDGNNYIVYVVPIGKDWYSISVTESRDIYRPLRIMLYASGSSIILTCIIFTLMMLRSGRNSLVKDNLQSILGSSADIYMSLCDLDVINNSVIGIKNKNPAIAKVVESCDHNMRELFNGIMTGLPESPTKQAAIEFADLSTIDERMKDTDVATVEYISYGNIWVRARYVVSERTPEGKVAHVIWMLEDIDKEKKERDQLIDISEKAQAASEAKSAFLSNMSHEIRTPINAVLGLNEMVLRESDDENIVNYARNIKSAGRTLLGLINDILDFSKIESGKMEIIKVDYDLAAMINDLVTLIKRRTELKGLNLVLDIDQNTPQKLHGDDMRIRQIITNLLTNAVKYTEKGNITLSISYTKKDDKSIILHVSVRDTGIGIRKDDMKKLFSEYERIDEKKNRNIEGTGLGMSITRSLLSMMNSSLNVNSEYGIGSDFSFDLVQGVTGWEPIGDYEETFKRTMELKEEERKSFTAKDARILVIDDNSVNLLVFASLLKHTLMTIDRVQNGDEGLKHMLENKYDIIFLDHMMPEKNGIEILKEFRSHRDNINSDTPVICLTANALTGARQKYMEAGFNDYLTKPIDSVLLEEMVISYLPEEKVIRDK
ncbi:MAG: response regulator [Lachnospiraceae bacterium]|nr:response regulator [Lachnospiraceae bacterium]